MSGSIHAGIGKICPYEEFFKYKHLKFRNSLKTDIVFEVTERDSWEILECALYITRHALNAYYRKPCKVRWKSDLVKLQNISELITGIKGFEVAILDLGIIIARK